MLQEQPQSNPGTISYVTRELTSGESALQAGWAKRNSGLLDRIDTNGDVIVIRRRDGSVDELRKGEFTCTTYRTSSRRRLFVIKTRDGRKIQFMEMDGMLTTEEWDAIARDILEATPSQLNSILYRASIAIPSGMLAAALTTGVLGAMLHLKEEQMHFSSPLCLGLMAIWITGLWFLIGRLRR
jgi:hypothetical protein